MKNILMVYDGKCVLSSIIEGLVSWINTRSDFMLTSVYLSEKGQEDFVTHHVIFVNTVSEKSMLLKRRLDSQGFPYTYIADDDFLGMDDFSHQILLRRAALEFILDSQRVIVGSEVMLNRVKSIGGKPFFIRPFFDFSLIKEVNHNAKEKNPKLRIGYPSLRLKDLFILQDPLLALLRERRDEIEFESFGYKPLDFYGYSNINYYAPIYDYSGYHAFKRKRNWNIGLAPLLDMHGRTSKTNNKYRELGAHMICGIYSNVHPYKECIENSETGVLVDNNPFDWGDALNEIANDETLRERIARNAFEDVRSRYSIDKVGEDWIAFLELISSNSIAGRVNIEIRPLTLYGLHAMNILRNGQRVKSGVINELSTSINEVGHLNAGLWIVSRGIRRLSRIISG